MNFIDACRAVIGVESTPAAGTRAVAALVGELCADAGLHVETFPETVRGTPECSVTARPLAGRPAAEFLLHGRLGTAAAGHYARWTKTRANPFDASIYGDVMYGLGTADAKLDLLCKIEAARSFAGRRLRLPFVVAATYDAVSAADLIREGRAAPEFALVGEPTELRLHGSGAGSAAIEIWIPFSDEERAYRRDHDLLESTSTQSRVFNAGAGGNALTQMFDYLTQLPKGVAIMDLNGGGDWRATPTQAVLELDVVAGFRDPILPKITTVRGAVVAVADAMILGAVRTTADGVGLTGGCFVPAGVTESAYRARVGSLGAACAAVGATFSVKEYRGGFETDPDGAFVKAAQDILADMGLDSRLSQQSVTSEANVFSQLGLECLAWGPGRGFGNSHAPDEHVDVRELKSAVAFYRRTIERFCT